MTNNTEPSSTSAVASEWQVVSLDVLREKYHFSKEDAQAVGDFLKPLLEFDPKTRSTALDALKSKWLS